MILYDACRAMFGMTDLLRRAQGQSFEDFGLGPEECPYEVVASGAFWRHRDYCKSYSQSVLIVAAPIKRAYIWDLVPPSSAIRYILRQGFHVHLLEWLPAETPGEYGLAEYAESISECGCKDFTQAFRCKDVSDGSFAGRHAGSDIRSFRI